MQLAGLSDDFFERLSGFLRGSHLLRLWVCGNIALNMKLSNSPIRFEQSFPPGAAFGAPTILPRFTRLRELKLDCIGEDNMNVRLQLSGGLELSHIPASVQYMSLNFVSSLGLICEAVNRTTYRLVDLKSRFPNLKTLRIDDKLYYRSEIDLEIDNEEELPSGFQELSIPVQKYIDSTGARLNYIPRYIYSWDAQQDNLKAPLPPQLTKLRIYNISRPLPRTLLAPLTNLLTLRLSCSHFARDSGKQFDDTNEMEVEEEKAEDHLGAGEDKLFPRYFWRSLPRSLTDLEVYSFSGRLNKTIVPLLPSSLTSLHFWEKFQAVQDYDSLPEKEEWLAYLPNLTSIETKCFMSPDSALEVLPYLPPTLQTLPPAIEQLSFDDHWHHFPPSLTSLDFFFTNWLEPKLEFLPKLATLGWNGYAHLLNGVNPSNILTDLRLTYSYNPTIYHKRAVESESLQEIQSSPSSEYDIPTLPFPSLTRLQYSTPLPIESIQHARFRLKYFAPTLDSPSEFGLLDWSWPSLSSIETLLIAFLPPTASTSTYDDPVHGRLHYRTDYRAPSTISRSPNTSSSSQQHPPFDPATFFPKNFPWERATSQLQPSDSSTPSRSNLTRFQIGPSIENSYSTRDPIKGEFLCPPELLLALPKTIREFTLSYAFSRPLEPEVLLNLPCRFNLVYLSLPISIDSDNLTFEHLMAFGKALQTLMLPPSSQFPNDLQEARDQLTRKYPGIWRVNLGSVSVLPK